jgi:hypothetical protein
MTTSLLPIVQAIANSISDRLSTREAELFDGLVAHELSADADMLGLPWKFLAEELRNLPSQQAEAEVQAVINQVICGLGLLAAGQEWPDVAGENIRCIAKIVMAAAVAVRIAHGPYVKAAEAASWAAECFKAAIAACAADDNEGVAIAVARAAELAAKAHTDLTAATRRQGYLLLQLLAEV